MNKKNIIFSLLICFGIISMCISTYANTAIDADNNALKSQSYNTALSPAYIRNNVTEQYVNPQSGELNLIQTDYVLPGKNGLDLEIKRIYKTESVNVFKVSQVNGSIAVIFNYDSFYEDRYNLGIGTSFSFPALEISSGSKFFHSENGDVYTLESISKINNKTSYGLKEQVVSDIVIIEDTPADFDYTANAVGIITASEILNPTMAYTYDYAGNILTETNKANQTTTHTYNLLNLLLTTSFAGIRQIKKEYDDNGNVIEVHDALDNKTYYSYTAHNAIKSMSDEEGVTVTYDYNQFGEKAKQTDALNNSTIYEYDTAGRLINVTDALGNKTVYHYNQSGQKICMIDAKGNETIYKYGSLGILAEVVDTENNVQIYTYDLMGNIASSKDKNGNTSTYKYNSRNQLINKKAIGADISYNYDVWGNRIEMNDVSGATNYSYDKANRILVAGSVSYAYDDIGNCTSVSYGNNTTSYTYDDSNRIETVKQNNNTVATYEYYNNNYKKSVTYGNGAKTEYTYYKNNNIESVVNKKGSTIYSEYEYEYDLRGLQTKKTEKVNEDAEETNYIYDEVARLKQVVSEDKTATYAYDETGNRISVQEVYTQPQTVKYIDDRTEQFTNKTTQYIYSPTNKLLSANERFGEEAIVLERQTQYVYDANGNQRMQNKVYITNPEEPSNEVGIAIIKKTGTENFDKYIDVVYNEYDGFNRLVEYENINGGSKTKVSFTYNGDDLRVSKTTAEGTTTYTYSGQYVIEDTQNTYIMGMGYIGMTTGEYYMFNGHGDVVQTVDGTGVKNSYTYDEFGNLTSELNETDTNSILYAGEFYDRETGLYYLRARYYNPNQGRFITEDTYKGDITNPATLNLYTYCNNDPINFVDPSGNSWLAIGAAITGGIAVIAEAIKNNSSNNSYSVHSSGGSSSSGSSGYYDGAGTTTYNMGGGSQAYQPWYGENSGSIDGSSSITTFNYEQYLYIKHTPDNMESLDDMNKSSINSAIRAYYGGFISEDDLEKNIASNGGKSAYYVKAEEGVITLTYIKDSVEAEFIPATYNPELRLLSYNTSTGKIEFVDSTGYFHSYSSDGIFNALINDGPIVFGVDSHNRKKHYMVSIFQYMYNVSMGGSLSIDGYAGVEFPLNKTETALRIFAESAEITGYMRGSNGKEYPAFGSTTYASLEFQYNVAIGMSKYKAQQIFDSRRAKLGLNRRVDPIFHIKSENKLNNIKESFLVLDHTNTNEYIIGKGLAEAFVNTLFYQTQRNPLVIGRTQYTSWSYAGFSYEKKYYDALQANLKGEEALMVIAGIADFAYTSYENYAMMKESVPDPRLALVGAAAVTALDVFFNDEPGLSDFVDSTLGEYARSSIKIASNNYDAIQNSPYKYVLDFNQSFGLNRVRSDYVEGLESIKNVIQSGNINVENGEQIKQYALDYIDTVIFLNNNRVNTEEGIKFKTK